jgi:hypothetical protein
VHGEVTFLCSDAQQLPPVHPWHVEIEHHHPGRVLA